MAFQIIAVTNTISIQHIRNFRAQVWTKEGLLSPSDINTVVLDEHDEDARHWMVQIKGEVIAAARLSLCSSILEAPDSESLMPFESFIPTPFGYLSRLVVRSDFRGKGIAKQLDHLRMQEAYKSGAKAVTGLAVPWRVKPLRKLGFVALGEEAVSSLYNSPLPIRVMVHHLGTTASSGR
jgi:predicted GNAT family N-acyltransferase